MVAYLQNTYLCLNGDIVIEVFVDQEVHLKNEHPRGGDKNDRPEDAQTNILRTADVWNAVRRRPATEVTKNLSNAHFC